MKTNYCILGNNYHIENVENIYDEISALDFNKTELEEVTRLDEDLFQLALNPSFEEGGEFIIQMIQNSDWDHPIIKISSGWDKNELIEKLNIVLEQLPFCLKS